LSHLPFSPTELDVIGQCLRALSGRTPHAHDAPRGGSVARPSSAGRRDFEKIGSQWPDVDFRDPAVALAVINALAAQLGPGYESHPATPVAASKGEIREVLRKVRPANAGTHWERARIWAACYGELPPPVAVPLDSVPPTGNGALEYRPCMVTLADGRTLECVYIVEAVSYFQVWGVWPEDDRGKRSVRIEDVVEIRDSPLRLPAGLANQLYEAGESGMGYLIFTAEFRDATRQAYVTGNAVDFIVPPRGLKASDAIRVISHEGRYDAPVPSPDYWWCLFTTARYEL
jgi:hypothetical protein